ncbi:MAG: hypothetical protein COB04_03995 [Gammaproteobacteria bacterium]|nr:MAG: hypothetical protein COB04_03995 [Gammaproteobacteria bacterium]
MSDVSTPNSDENDRTLEAIKDWFEDLNITDFYSIPFITPKKEGDEEKKDEKGSELNIEAGKYYKNKTTGQVIWVNPYGQAIDQTTLTGVEIDSAQDWVLTTDK